MATVASALKQAVHDKFKSQIKTAEADLDVLRARARVAKANVELKAIAELFPKKQIIRAKLDELRSSSEDRWKK